MKQNRQLFFLNVLFSFLIFIEITLHRRDEQENRKNGQAGSDYSREKF